MSATAAPAQVLVDLKPKFSFFVGIDSDGCAFDSMEIKHKECFCPNIVKYWHLQPVAKYAREAVEFVNLYSKWRGTNRWPALVNALDLLRVRDEVKRRKCNIPGVVKIREFIASGSPLSNDGLKQYMAANPDGELDYAMEWSMAVNNAISDMVHDLPPFPFVRESLELLNQSADCAVVSQTPTDALVREWEEHGIDRYVRVIAGQELGTKKQHLKMAAGEKYAENHVLMIGDAMGDMEAAKANNALFFPINPGHEEDSWKRFYDEGIPRFLAGEFAGQYEAALISEFNQYLPTKAPWQK